MNQVTISGELFSPQHQRSMHYDRNKTQERFNREFYRLEDRCRSALKELGKSMGYNLTGTSISDRKLVLADAISTLEKLKFGERITRRPRELEERKVIKTLHDLIPTDYVVKIFVRAGATEDETSRAELVEVMTAASTFIDELKKGGAGEQVIPRPMAEPEPRGSRQQPVVAQNIETALKKMEEWCDAWLNGNLNDEEWENFENCLDK